MSAVSEFTKAKIVTFHQRGRYVVWANAEVGTHWDGGSASSFWKKAGVFCGTERGTPELSPKSVPVHEEQIALGCTTKWSNDQILTSSVLVVKYFFILNF
jgi:hypothetical protein